MSGSVQVNLQGIKAVAEVGQERKRHTWQKVKGSNMGGAETWAKIGQKIGKIWGTTLRGKWLLHEQEVAGSSPAPPTTPKILKFARKIPK